VLPGDTSRAIWTSYLPFDALPRLQDPPRGFVQNANSTPFTASGPGSLDPDAWPAALGIERRETERSLRLLALLGGTEPLSPEAFERVKWDQRYDGRAWVDDALSKLLATPGDGNVADAQSLLRRWDRTLPGASREGALAILALTPFEKAHYGRAPAPESPLGTLAEAAATLREHFGRLDPPLAEVQRLRRGSVDLGLGGGPDVVAATYATLGADGRLVGHSGDCFVMLADFGPEGGRSRAIHQYGSSSRPDSAHYADQAPLFVRHELRPVWRTLSEIRANLEAEYSPGEAHREATSSP
jgi:acyl-homoserine lactone acylase PvdQ